MQVGSRFKFASFQRIINLAFTVAHQKCAMNWLICVASLVVRLEELLENPGYNLLLHQAPFSMTANDHWYVELIPRLTRAAGFEWGNRHLD